MSLYKRIPKKDVESVKDLRKTANVTVDEFKKKLDKMYEELDLLKMDFEKKYKSVLEDFYNEDDLFYLGDNINSSLSSLYEVIYDIEKLDKEK